MFSKLRLLLAAMLGDSIARMLSGAGLALATGAVLVPVLSSALSELGGYMSGLPGGLLQVLALGGFGEALGIIGSALLTSVTIRSASVGLRKK